MERKKKLLVTMILSISILLGGFTNKNYAVNEVNGGNNTTTQTSTNTKANSNTTNNQTTAKSSNANLSDLGITPHDFTGFKYGTTSYEVVVPEDTEVVEVYAKTQQAKATVTGTGKKNLEKGENKAEVVVTAEDGTKKTYTINIIREIKQEEEEESNTGKETTNEKEKKGLAELKIDKLNLVPEFKTDVYEYKVKYIGENTILDIETKPTSENYVVEITGNENLKEGENIITILVSGENGDNVATYQITVNKSLVDEEAIAREEAQKKEEQKKIIIGVTIAVGILVIIVWIIIRHRRNKNLAEEFSGVSFYGNEEEEDEEEIPRSLRKTKREQEEIDEDGEAYEEDEIEKMPKEKLKEKFLNNYTASDDADFDNGYQENKRKGRYKGKRFK